MTQFRHSRAHYPGVVLDVVYSQKAKDLHVWLKNTSLDPMGKSVCHLHNKGTNKATISVWEPRIVSNDIREDELVVVRVIADQISLNNRSFPIWREYQIGLP
jgi:hypothetical protein